MTPSKIKIWVWFRRFSFALLGFFGGAAIGFFFLRSIHFFNLLRDGAYHIQTIFYNSFYEILFGVPVGVIIGIGLAIFALKKRIKLIYFASGLITASLLTFGLTEVLDGQLRPRLVRAAQYNRMNEVKAAIQSGSDLNVRDIMGRTALNEAIAHRHFTIALILISAGVDVNLADDFGNTPLKIAARYSDPNLDTIEALISAGADLNKSDERGNTILINLVKNIGRNNKIEIVKILVAAGADVRVKNNQGETALELAQKRNLTDLVSLFKKAEKKSSVF